MRWVALVGGKGEVRRKATDALSEHLRALGLRVGGFVAKPAPPREGKEEHPDYILEDLVTGERVALAFATDTDPDLCAYRFASEAFETAARWVADEHLDIVFLGGLGPLEASRRGHWELVQRLVEREGRPVLVLVIRRDALTSIALELPGDPAAGLELPADDAALRAFAREIHSLVVASA